MNHLCLNLSEPSPFFTVSMLAGRAADKCIAKEIFTVREHSHMVVLSLLPELMLVEGGGSPQ